MDIKHIVSQLQNCPCGQAHLLDDMIVEIGPGLLQKTAEIMKDFPKKLLVVADNNTLAASSGIIEILENNGFHCKLKLFDDLRTADIRDADELEVLAQDVEGILSIGSGSLSDICRLAAFKAEKSFAIFATAPSMDGFASNSSPVTINSFKKSLFCRVPDIIIGDTDVLAKAPLELKAAGFGDMIAKYIALVDWKVAHLTVNEHYCPNVAGLTKTALDKVVVLADKVSTENTDAAGALMEGLVLSGLAMAFVNKTRPASGAEHVVSHFWESKTLEQGKHSDFHGKKVGVASLLITRLYHNIALSKVCFQKDSTDWEKVYSVYGPNFRDEVEKCNTPTVTDETSPQILSESWETICNIIKNELPAYETLLSLMNKAGAVTTIDEIGVDPELALAGLKYHPYMRYRMNMTRLIPMLGISGIEKSVL